MLTIKRFTATWCGPCKQLSPIINKLRRENTDVTFVDIDVDDNPVVRDKYGVRSVPTIVFEVNNKEVQRIVGVRSETELQNIIDLHN